MHRVFERQAKALTRLRVYAGLSEALLVAHTTLFEISCTDSYVFISVLCANLIVYSQYVWSLYIRNQIIEFAYLSNMRAAMNLH